LSAGKVSSSADGAKIAPELTAMRIVLQHDPENACPGRDPGWVPVFGKDHAPTMSWSGMTIRRKVILL
jgi:hypothetical protein